MSDQHTKSLRAFKEADLAREKALAELKALEAGPRVIDPSNQAELNASVEDIAAGRAIVQHTERPRRKLHANEIDRRDTKAMGQYLEQIASGEKIVVDVSTLEYEVVDPTAVTK